MILDLPKSTWLFIAATLEDRVRPVQLPMVTEALTSTAKTIRDAVAQTPDEPEPQVTAAPDRMGTPRVRFWDSDT